MRASGRTDRLEKAYSSFSQFCKCTYEAQITTGSSFGIWLLYSSVSLITVHLVIWLKCPNRLSLGLMRKNVNEDRNSTQNVHRSHTALRTLPIEHVRKCVGKYHVWLFSARSAVDKCTSNSAFNCRKNNPINMKFVIDIVTPFFPSTSILYRYIDIFVNCNWVDTRWQ